MRIDGGDCIDTSTSTNRTEPAAPSHAAGRTIQSHFEPHKSPIIDYKSISFREQGVKLALALAGCYPISMRWAEYPATDRKNKSSIWCRYVNVNQFANTYQQ